MIVTQYENLNAETNTNYNGTALNRVLVDVVVPVYAKACLSIAAFSLINATSAINYKLELIKDGQAISTVNGVKQIGNFSLQGLTNILQNKTDPFPSLMFVSSLNQLGAAIMYPGGDVAMYQLKVGAEPTVVQATSPDIVQDCVTWRQNGLSIQDDTGANVRTANAICIGYPNYLKLGIDRIRFTLVSLQASNASALSNGSTVCQILYKEA